MTEKKANTSWENVSLWYDTLLSDGKTYQSELILPYLHRLIGEMKGKKMLDLACGQGLFAHAFAEAGAEVTGIDASKTLIDRAKKHTKKANFVVAQANKLPIQDNSIDITVSVLALQNIEDIAGTFREVSRVMTPQGKFFIVLNHPAFRIPKSSSWGFDEATSTQYRKIERYMTESREDILMNPGGAGDVKTISFHRPLQVWSKTLANAGFTINRIEEWTSHKKSEKGLRQKSEDKARNEIPLFMMIEARKTAS